MTNEHRSQPSADEQPNIHDQPGAEEHTRAPDPHRWRWAVLAVVLAAEVMDLLDATIIAIAGPSVRADLGGGTAFLQWLAAGYTLAFAVGLVTGGRLGDIFGRRRMFLAGAAGFTLMSLLCAVAPGPAWLVACRVLQGLCGAVLIPQGLGLIKAAFPPDKLGSAFGAFGPVMGLSAVCGPILAGVLVDADLFGTGWRMIFLINLPVGLAALAGAALVLPRAAERDRALRLDLPGTALLGGALLLLVFPLVQGRELGWPWWCWAAMAASAPALWAFQRYERGRVRAGRSPLVEPSLLAKRRFNAGLLVGLIFFAGLMGLTLIISVYLQSGLGYSPLRAGLAQSPWAFGTAVGAVAAQVLGARFGGRRLLVAGTAVVGLGAAALLATLAATGGPATPWPLVPALLVLGIGMGASMAPYFDIVLAAVDEHEVGSASGTLTAAQQVGGAIGVAVLGTAFFSWVGGNGFTGSLERVLWLEIALLALAGALCFLLPPRAREEPGDGSEPDSTVVTRETDGAHAATVTG
ncbi:MFS transporter [Dactylosporangium darangshiense]|uniref:MFS transporter n=1 Tax=Dactylosporangium darangshiense TaxID=579108 RepID=UPI0031EFD7FF